MDIEEAIIKRRSFRDYSTDDIPYDDILDIIKKGTLAPIAGNLDHYKFIIIKNPETIEKISSAAKQEFIKKANTLIVIISNDQKMISFYGNKGKEYALQDTAATAENIILYALNKNVGTCWIGNFDEAKIKEILQIPKEYNVHIIITMGYINNTPKETPRKNLNEIVYFEKYGNSLYKPQYYPLMSNIKNIINYLKNVFEKQ
ncbi:coenzyme F420:L-glutamate ligase [Nanobdella aerobiophila]|uniref:Coenzyme F420:L-glutamate ligase n=1 Tax=Nanobdella aerobiophila TaxID=2586965 RepID=A0A915WRK8_9ARCH|nr:nitroreductase family protein [Nanobdella aerobiophila]BBL45768.1 coenzyme F420:L-glutamate ligase [Nanobdella aerobiophila]